MEILSINSQLNDLAWAFKEIMDSGSVQGHRAKGGVGKAFVHRSEEKKVPGSRSNQNVQFMSQESVAVNLMVKLGHQTKW
jgi:hypothetical protein